MPTLHSSTAAGLVLAAISVLKSHKLIAPTPGEVFAAISASRTTAYKFKAAIESSLVDLEKPSGRPKKEAPTDTDDGRLAIAQQVLEFVYSHPGCVTGSTRRRTYSDSFRLMVLQLCEASPLPHEALAEAIGVPLPTLNEWMRDSSPQPVADSDTPTAESSGSGITQIETVLAAFQGWKGGFIAFCQHVELNLRLPFGRQSISDILQAHAVRIPKRRSRETDASAMRGAFESFFPNAQWVGDGTELRVAIAGRLFKVNLELHIDVHTSAIVGASVRKTEDAAAVIDAFDDGVVTVAEPPIALLLDNKPSNHCDDVDKALGDTLLMRSRPYVPTDKPHVEGTFGLFKQEAPPIVLESKHPEDLAAEIAKLMVQTWSRAVNHRPRADRRGKSRVDLFVGAQPTKEEVNAATKALRERQRKQELARQTRQRRQDPATRAILDAAFERLKLDDPESFLRNAIATWPLDSIIEGIAIFEGKKSAGTLPEGVDGRYLRGIVKNLAQEREGLLIMESLLLQRLAARDIMLERLVDQRDRLHQDAEDIEESIRRYVSKAMDTRRGIDRTFWLLATADIIRTADANNTQRLAQLAGRRINATYAVQHNERLAATRLLFAKIIPLN